MGCDLNGKSSETDQVSDKSNSLLIAQFSHSSRHLCSKWNIPLIYQVWIYDHIWNISSVCLSTTACNNRTLWKMLFSEIWFHETLLQDDIDHQFQFSDWWNMYLVTFLMTPGHHNCHLELDFVRKLTWYILWPLRRKLHLLVDAIQEFFIQFLKTQSFRIPGKRTSAIGPWHTYQLWYNLIYLSLAYS